MNHKFIRRNLPLIVVLSLTGVVALGLLVYVVILVIQWDGYWERTDNARKEIRKLVAHKPSPSDENRQRISDDIVVCRQAAEKLRQKFVSPLQPALDAFFRELPAPNRSAFRILQEDGTEDKEQTDAEVAKYSATREKFGEFLEKKYGSVEALNRQWKKDPGYESFGDVSLPAAAAVAAKDVKNPAVADFIEAFGPDAAPGKIMRFTQAAFTTFFREKFDRYCQRNGKDDDVRLSLTTLNEFMSSNSGDFPAGGWNRAMEAFALAAKTATCEPVNNYNNVAALIVALGLPRRVDNDLRAVERHVEDTIEAISKQALKNKLELGHDTLIFVGGDPAHPLNNPEDYGLALFQWDVFGDIVSRLGGAGVRSLNKVVLRSSGEEEQRGEGAPKVNLRGAMEQAGDFGIYHYTLEFSGSMESVRRALHAFDAAGKDNRIYIVRSICLYSKENGAGVIMRQSSEGRVNEETPEDYGEASSGRGFRRRRSSAPQPRVQENRKEEDDRQREIALREAALPADQRSDYGMIVIGGEPECLVYLDLDYVILQQNQ